MSLLETNNKKFNLPFVFIAGVVFLVVLAYFAAYMETLSEDVKSTEKTNTFTNEVNVSIRIDKNQDIYLDDEKVSIADVALRLESKLEESESLVIKLQSEEVSSQRALEIMEIARTNDYTVILEVSSK